MLKLSASVSIFLFISLPAIALAEENADQIPALIMKVEGSALIRKNSRIEESAGVGGKVYVGDTVVTNESSTVQLMTADGSMVKVGFDSRFLFEDISLLERAVTWSFQLIKGQLRALVVKKPDNQVRFKVKTPTAAMGIRGTEFVLVYSEEAASSYLYTIEGLIEYGPIGCEKSKSCVDVRAGESSLVKKGGPATRPVHFNLKDLLARAGSKKDSAARLSLFVNAAKASTGDAAFPGQAESDESLKQLVEQSSEELAEGQDRALGRNKDEREKVNSSIKAGVYQSIMEKADSYSRAKLADEVGDSGGADEIVGASAMAKFRLGSAVKGAEDEQLFTPSRSAETPSFEIKKNVSYDKTNKLKELAPQLQTSGRDYADIIGTSLPPNKTDSVSPSSRAGTSSASQNSRGSTAKNNASENANGNNSSNNRGNDGKAVSTCTGKCVLSATARIAAATSEKSVAAFTGVNMLPTNSTAAQTSTTTNTKTDGRNAKEQTPKECFQTVEDCKLQLCSGFERGIPCKKGTSTKVCSSKKVAVECK